MTTAGSFVPGHSLLHRLDARTKLAGLVILLVAVGMTGTVGGYLFLLGVTAAVVAAAGMPLRQLWAIVRPMGAFLLLVFCMNAAFAGGAGPLWTWGIFHVARAGIRQGANVALRVLFLLVLGGAFTYTTAPTEVTSALEKFMRPLGLLHVPVEETAMVLGVAVQFIPTLMRETDAIRKAQTARGARLESRSPLERARECLPLIVPVFLTAFRRADELALAMEARGYRNARERTHPARKPLRAADLAALGGCVAVGVIRLCVFR